MDCLLRKPSQFCIATQGYLYVQYSLFHNVHISHLVYRRFVVSRMVIHTPYLFIPPTNYYSIKPYSNPSGPMVYNSGAMLPPPTLKFWNDSNLRSCASLWKPHGTSLFHSSEGTSAALQSKKKSAVTALTMVIDFAPIPIISQ
jgi:hypothetical protein